MVICLCVTIFYLQLIIYSNNIPSFHLYDTLWSCSQYKNVFFFLLCIEEFSIQHQWHWVYFYLLACQKCTEMFSVSCVVFLSYRSTRLFTEEIHWIHDMEEQIETQYATIISDWLNTYSVSYKDNTSVFFYVLQVQMHYSS